MNTQTEMNEMKKMMNQYLEHTYKDKNVLKVQKCRWNKRLLSDLPKNHTGSTATLMHMLDFMIYQKNTYNNFIKFIISNSINMPVKKGKDKGLLTTAEIRRLISAHNKLSKIVIPKGTDRDGLVQLIKSRGYKINHKEQRLDPQPINRPPLKIINMPPKKPRKVAVVKPPSQSFNVKNTKVAQVKNKPKPVKVVDPYAQTSENKDLQDFEDRLKDMSEVIVKNKNNFGANGGEKAIKKIDDLFKEVTSIGGGIVNLQKKSPKTIKYFTNILNSIHRHPPKTNEGVILPQLERFKIWNRYISDSAKKDRAKILKERKDALKPNKEKVKKPAVKKPAVNSMNLEVGDKVVKYKDVYKIPAYNDRKKKGYEVGEKPTDDISEGGIISKITPKKVFMTLVGDLKGEKIKYKVETMIKNIIEIKKANKSDKPEVKKPDVKKPAVKKEEPTNTKKAQDLYETIKDKKWNSVTRSKLESYWTYDAGRYRVVDATIKGNKFTIFYYFTDNWVEFTYGYDKSDYTEQEKKDIDTIMKKRQKAVFTIPAEKPEVKKPVEDDESEDEEDARLKRKEITARNDPLTEKLRLVISMKDKILKKVKNDPTIIQGETARKTNKLISELVTPILEYIKKLEDDNNIRFSESILDQYQFKLIQNLRSDMKEIMGSKN